MAAVADGQRMRISIRLTPKGGRDAIDGWWQDASGARHLKARVSAPPEDGKANRALTELIAGALGVARSKVTIVAGETSRLKTVEVDGDPAVLSARLAAKAGAR